VRFNPASLLAAFAISLALVGSALAQSDGGSDQAPPADEAPTGPVLQPSDNAPVICDPNSPGFRYVEVRGSGFDAWSTQHLVGALFDASGAARERWNSVWVTPQGSLTLVVNLCADPIQKHGALDPGDYTVAIGQSSGGTIASAAISVSPPVEPGAETETDQPETMPQSGPVSQLPQFDPALLTPTPVATYVIPNIQGRPTPTPIPIPGAATPVPVAGPRTGPGSQQQPLPLGAPGNLVDGWQLVIQGISPDAYQGIKAEVPLATAPASDQRDYIVRAQATYLGLGTGVFSAVRLSLYSTATGQTYDQMSNNCGVIPDPLNPIVVTQGNSTRGNVCFVVRASDVNSLIAYVNQQNIGDRVYFALQ